MAGYQDVEKQHSSETGSRTQTWAGSPGKCFEVLRAECGIVQMLLKTYSVCALQRWMQRMV